MFGLQSVEHTGNFKHARIVLLENQFREIGILHLSVLIMNNVIDCIILKGCGSFFIGQKRKMFFVTNRPCQLLL